MPVAAPPRTEYKTIPLERVAVKAAGSSTREFTGYASRWDDVDWMGDTVRRGAFTATLQQRPTRPLLWDHNPGMPIGVELELVEDAVGLRGTWRLSQTGAADDAYTLLRDGAVSGLSIGFIPRETRDGPDGTREILAVDLMEVSVVSMPALDSARVTDVKSARGAATMSVAQRLATYRALTPLPSPSRAPRSLGEQVVASAEYKALAGSSALRSDLAVPRLRVEVPDLSLKALVTSLLADGELAADSLAASDTPELLVDRLRVVPTVQNAVQVARQSVAASAAAVAEATAATGTTGTFQETALGWSETLSYVETVSAWLPATRSLLADAAGIQALIDGELVYAVRRALEAQALTGNGTRPNLQGLANLPGINTVAVGAAGSLAAIADAIGRARRLGRRRPDVIVMSGICWDVLAMARENSATGTLGGALLGPPGLLVEPSLFGLPVIPSEELTAGTALVGATPTATIYERLGATVSIGTVNDLFTRNMVALRCQVRATLAVTRPAAWSLVTGLATS